MDQTEFSESLGPENFCDDIFEALRKARQIIDNQPGEIHDG